MNKSSVAVDIDASVIDFYECLLNGGTEAILDANEAGCDNGFVPAVDTTPLEIKKKLLFQ